MKRIFVLVTLAALSATAFASTASAGLPGAWYQQQQAGYPQSPPGGS
jgi:hypothetical protein